MALKISLRIWNSRLKIPNTALSIRNVILMNQVRCTQGTNQSIQEYFIDDLTSEEKQEQLDKKSNKSNLQEKDYRRLYNQPPILTEDEKYVMRLKDYRKLYGEFGNSSNINKAALWPSTEELELLKDYERVAFPNSCSEMINIEKERIETERRLSSERQKKIQENLTKLDGWMENIRKKKEHEKEIKRNYMAKKRKELEEVRQMLGYTISPQDPKFAETLELKEAEDRKRAKREKKLKKEQKYLEELKKLAEQDVIQPPTETEKGKIDSTSDASPKNS